MKKVIVWVCIFVMLSAGMVLAAAPKKGEATPAAAKKAEAPTVTPKKGGTLVFGRGGDSVGLDPAYETDGNSFMICDNILEALVFYKDESTTLEPGLATSWEISPDGLTYTFKLRKGVKFHDGTAFNADAVVFSIGRMMKNRNVKFSGKGWDIPKQERPPEYWVSMGMDDTVDSIEAADDSTVVFKLKKIQAPFIANMGMDFADIISPTAFMKDPKGFVRNPVGTGPYKLAKWVKDDRITLEANKDYWDKAKGPFLDRLIFRVIPENSVRFLELKAGNVHMIDFPNPADIEMARKDPKLQVITQPGMNIGYLGYNHKKELWKNLKLRLALAHAINRKAIVDKIYQGMGEVAKNGIPPTMWGYNKDVPGYRLRRRPGQEIPRRGRLSRRERAPGDHPLVHAGGPALQPGRAQGRRRDDRRSGEDRHQRPDRQLRLGDLSQAPAGAQPGHGPLPARLDRRQRRSGQFPGGPVRRHGIRRRPDSVA